MQTKQSAEQNQETLIIEEKFQGPNGETMIKKYEQS